MPRVTLPIRLKILGTGQGRREYGEMTTFFAAASPVPAIGDTGRLTFAAPAIEATIP